MKMIITNKKNDLSVLLKLIIVLVILMQSPRVISQNPGDERAPDAALLGYPPTWNPVVATNNAHIMIILMSANPRINNIPINEGDYIGVFYTDLDGQLKCAGADYWKNLTPIAQPDTGIVFAVWGDDGSTQQQKEGFVYGELMHFKVFSWTTQKTYDVDNIGFKTGGNYSGTQWWYPLAISGMNNLQCLETFDAYATATPNPVCLNNTVSLAANIFVGTTGNYTFNWTSTPAGFTSALRYPTATPLINTTYNLVASDGTNTSNHQVSVVVNQNSQVNAGSDATICANQTKQLSGSATNYSTRLWSTSGNGSFSNATLLNPVYTPGTIDKQNGSAVLTLIVQPLQGCTLTASDQMIVTILPLPTVNAGDDKSVCKGSNVLLNATAQNYSTILWTTAGDGTFSSTNILNPQYFPGNNDLTVGNFTLTIAINATTGCTGTASDQIKITLIPLPTAGGPNSKTICETAASVTTNGTATNFSSLLWITAGDGTFANPNVAATTYVPGTNDKQNGGTTITLYSYPVNPCTVPATKNVSIIIQRSPIIDAGNTDKVCQGLSLQLNASASFYNQLSWSTSGNGGFNNTTILNPIYTPGSADIAAGQFTLTLLGTAKIPCTTSVSSNLLVQIVGPPSVQITTTPNQTLCATNPLQLNATGNYYDYLQWTTSGNGTFSNTAIINPIYIPGTSDVTLSPITLTLTGFAIVGCGSNSVKQISETFVAAPTANAGTNATICQSSTHTLSGLATHNSSVSWTTSGTGTFSSTTILNPVYTPSAADLTTGMVTLTLTAAAVSPCTVSASASKTLTFQKTPTANAGTNVTICQGSTHTLSGTATNYANILWTTSGTGTFNSASSLTAIYTPGAADISAGTVTLTLTSSAVSPCTVAATSSKILTIQKAPIANAGTNATICQGSTHTLAGTATNNATVAWTTSGTGTFSSTIILTPVYTPSASDITAGTVTLTLTVTAVSPCTTSAFSSKTLTIQKPPTANAGSNATICQGSTHQLSGSAQNYGTLAWTTSGTGTFNSTSSLTPIYTPSAADINAGTVTLTLTAFAVSPCTTAASANKTLVIQNAPTANAGANSTVCQGGTHQLSGSATNYQSLAWTTSGSGTFSSTIILNPVYTPSAADITAGTVTLTLTASAVLPCSTAASSGKLLTIQKTPAANAGNNATICQGSTHQLSGSAQNYGTVVWTTSGTGTFNSVSSLTAVYTPGAADISAGSVTLTLTASAVSPCTLAASDNKILTIQKTPTANAGSNSTVCQGGTHQLSGSATNYQSLAWTTSGSGTFSSTIILNPVYTPSAADITAGTVTLTLTASAVSPCSTAASSGKLLTIQKTPAANAGNNATICQGSTHQLSGSAQNYGTITWTTSGTGTFSSTSSLTAVYTPGATDITAGSVTLTLTASAVSPCTTVASSSKTLAIQKTPTANAGSNATICQGSTHTLAGTVTNYQSLAWTTSGTGTFNSATILNPVYTPSAADNTAGLVTLTLTASAVSPCSTAASSSKSLTIRKTPTANAGADATILDSQSFTVSATATNYSSLLWQTSGDGTFSSASSLTAIYTPGAADIQNSTVVLTLSAVANSPCPGPANDALTLTIMRQQIIQIPSGWSGLSSFVLPLNTAFDQVMAPVSNNLILAKTFLDIYWPQYGINTIGNFDPAKGYVVKMSAAAALPVTGFKSQNKTVQLSAGWNILPVISDINVNSQVLISQISNQLIILTEIAGGGLIWPSQNINTIPFLLPGKAYYIKVNSACSFTFPN